MSTAKGSRVVAGSVIAVLVATALVSCGSDSDSDARTTTTVESSDQTTSDHDGVEGVGIETADRVVALLANAAFQDVGEAEAAGYASTLDTLGCFEDEEEGGMGVHYLKEDLMDDQLAVEQPEALVYELDAGGRITGLVAHEYIVPTSAWSSSEPPTLFGTELHQHPTLPLWVLHVWLWKDNAAGILNDWNPAVRQCPRDVPVFGVDRPLPETTSSTAADAGAPAAEDAVASDIGRGPR
jgi:hypothetical protein